MTISNNELLRDIRYTFDAWIDAVLAFDHDQFNMVPFEGSWTPGQVAEHMTKGISELPDAHVSPAGRSYDERVAMIADVFLNFSTRLKSPAFVLPDGAPQEQGAVVGTFRQKQGYLENVVASKDLTELCLDFELPVFGKMTRYEWIKFFLFHLQRHTYQLQKILAVMGH